MKKRFRAAHLALAGALSLSLALPAAGAGTYVPAYNIHATGLLGQTKVDLPKSFVRGAHVMSGDENGDMNWSSTLTRAEAAAMLLRLMGLEYEAQETKDAPSPFTDVPQWANGYVNLAQQKGVVQGVGEGRFDPSGTCGAKEFLVMLFRLTHLTEGKDYAWATSVDDFAAAVEAVAADREGYHYSPPFDYGFSGQAFHDYVNYNGPFTREAAAGAMYLMLSIDAGENRESLGDILAQEYGLSSLLLYDNSVRRTAGELAEQTQAEICGLTGEHPTVFTLKDGKLLVNDPAGTRFQTSESADVGWVYLSAAEPLALPRADHTVSLSCDGAQGTYLDDEGQPVTVTVPHTVSLPILYRDGSWTFGPRSSLKDPDYAYLHAYRDEAHWIRVMESDYPSHVLDGYITEDIRTLAASLTQGLTGDYAKAEAVSRWVATHIFYDVDSATGKRADQSAAQVLSSRKAVCDGFARLTRELLRAAGVECWYETSLASDHAWNVAFLNGRWVVMDNTFDSNLKYENGVYLDYTGDSAPVVNPMEPKVDWLPRFFDADWDDFYGVRKLDREPIL